MTGDPAGRYSSTEHFLAHIDHDDHRTVATDDEAFGPFDIAEHRDADDPWPPGDGEPVWGDVAGHADDELGEPGPVGALPVHPHDPATEDGGAADDDPDSPYPGDHYDTDYGVEVGPGDTARLATVDPDTSDATDTFDATDEPGEDERSPRPTPRFSKPIVIGFLGAVGVVTIGLAAAMIGVQSSTSAGDHAATGPSTEHSVVAPPLAPPTTAAPVSDPTQDVPIPFQASSPCPQAGSGSAQNVASEDPTRAWNCIRDSDGQVMTLDLGRPTKVTAIELTPGWIGTDASGADQWMSHRVVTRVQWILINGADRTTITQDTKNAHGPVPVAMPSNGPDQGILASQIQMVILQTSRPPSDTPAPPATGGPSGTGLFDGILGAPLGGGPDANPSTGPRQDPTFGTTETRSDPVDNTVAISSIKILGHPPL